MCAGNRPNSYTRNGLTWITPLTTYETVVDRIGSTRTETGLWVRAELNAGRYPTGVTVTKEEMDAIALVRDGFHGEWNYKLLPR